MSSTVRPRSARGKLALAAIVGPRSRCVLQAPRNVLVAVESVKVLVVYDVDVIGRIV
jgi:glycine cleavage system aminomethyltransferase T